MQYADSERISHRMNFTPPLELRTDRRGYGVADAPGSWIIHGRKFPRFVPDPRSVRNILIIEIKSSAQFTTRRWIDKSDGNSRLVWKRNKNFTRFYFRWGGGPSGPSPRLGTKWCWNPTIKFTRHLIIFLLFVENFSAAHQDLSPPILSPLLRWNANVLLVVAAQFFEGTIIKDMWPVLFVTK